MNRRVRTHCSSSSSSSSSSPKREEGFYRFLKPGALAQLRDSRISARSQRPNLQISLHRASSSTSSSTGTDIRTQIEMIDGFPCFDRRIYNPRCPQRKKLVASKSIFFLSSSSDSISPLSDSSDSSSLMDVLNTTDLLVSH